MGQAVAQLARALKPGGRLAIQDYHRDTFMVVPKPDDWDDFIRADRAFFASQGGNVSIGGLIDVHAANQVDAYSTGTPGSISITNYGEPAGDVLITGKLNGQTAFLTGKLKIKGDMTLAMKLQSVFALGS